MATRRLHLELLVQVTRDLALQRKTREFDEERDIDDLTEFDGPKDVKLAAGATGTQVNFPAGSTKLRFLAVMNVDNANGVYVIFDDPGNDPVHVKPPPGSGQVGDFILFTSADALYLTNPDASAEVNLEIMTGFYAS